MHVKQILTRCFPAVFAAIHKTLQPVLLQAVEALVTGHRLTLINIARAWPDAAPFHAGQDISPDCRSVLTNATAEHNGIRSAKHGKVGTEVFACAVAKCRHREARIGIIGHQQAMHVTAGARQAKQSGLFIEQAF